MKKYVVMSPQIYINPEKDYYLEVSNFAKRVGLNMSCSNGIFTLASTPIVHRSHTKAHEEEVAKFKEKHPEYAKMKGCKHKEPGAVRYGLELGLNNGEVDGIRTRKMNEYINDPRNKLVHAIVLNYLLRNHYRRLNLDKINKKHYLENKLIEALLEFGYLNKTCKKKKTFIQLTEEGKKWTIKN